MYLAKAALIRKVYPDVIAADIIGDPIPLPPLPPSAFSSSVVPLKKSRIKRLPKAKHLEDLMYQYVITNAQYRHFIRLNNRRKTQTAYDLRKARYPEVMLDYKVIIGQMDDWSEWMEMNMRDQYFYAGSLQCFFASEELKTLYMLRWA